MREQVLLEESSQQLQTEFFRDRGDLEFRRLLEKLPAAAYTCDHQGLITYFNQHAVALWGREPKLNDAEDRFCGSFKLFSLDGSLIVHEQCWMALTLRENKAYNGHEIVIERPDGSHCTVLAYANPIHDELGTLIGAVNILVDITERERVDEKRSKLLAREREARGEAETLNEVARTLAAELDLQVLVQKVTDAGTKLTGARFGAFFYNAINQQGESYLLYTLSGAPREAFAGLGIPRNTPLFEPTFRGTEVVRIDDVLQDSRYGQNPPHHGMPQGHLPVRSYLAVPVVSRTGDVLGGLFFGHPEPGIFTERAERMAAGIAAQAAIAIDNARLYAQAQEEIAERTRAETFQAGQTRVLELIALDAPLSDVLQALVRTIEEQSRSGLLGSFLLLDHDGVHLRHGAAPSLPEAYNRAIDGIAIGPESGSCGTAAYTKKPVYVSDVATDPRWVNIKELALPHNLRACWSTPVCSSQGEVLGTFAMYYREVHHASEEDLRLVELATRTASIAIERKQAEEALRESDRRKDEFLATLAHELRNPLAPLRTDLELIRMLAEDRAELAETRARMERQVRQLTRLVDDLLDVSRISRGKIQLRKSRTDLASILESAMEAARPDIENLRHKLSIKLPRSPIYLDADADRLAQVFSNLLNNAAKYTPEGGAIGIAARQQGKDVVVTVKDSGIGIPADWLPRVFEMFAQVHRSADQRSGGLGIGLMLVKRLVEMHGGTIEACSDGPGHGSKFIVCLPAAMPDQEWMHDDKEEEGVRSTQSRILVADDNRDAAEALVDLLKALGHEVRIAYDGVQALEVAVSFRPDVAVLDIGMPKLNGLETARRMRTESWGKGVKLIALTGWGQEQDIRLSQETGFDHHLVKPIGLTSLQKLLADVRPG